MAELNIGNVNVAGDFVAGGKRVYHQRAEPPARTVLLLSANPEGQQPLRLDQERRAIDQALAHSRLELRTADALRLDDLQPALLRHRPVIVHFSGHGHPSDGLQVVGVSGRPRSIPPRALSGLFRFLGKDLLCVVLNACHTDDQAAAIAEHVPCVVGMRREVLDTTAILFATGFYQGIAHGRTIRESFELGRNALDLHDVPDRDRPRLIAQPGAADRRVPAP